MFGLTEYSFMSSQFNICSSKFIAMSSLVPNEFRCQSCLTRSKVSTTLIQSTIKKAGQRRKRTGVRNVQENYITT